MVSYGSVGCLAIIIIALFAWVLGLIFGNL